MLTSFHGIFPSAKNEPVTETVSVSQPPVSAVDETDPNKHHKMKKKKKKNKHKHKYKHKQDKHDKERSKDRPNKGLVRTDSFGVPSPMVPSVQSVTSMTSMSSMDNTRDSAPSSPDFEVI